MPDNRIADTLAHDHPQPGTAGKRHIATRPMRPRGCRIQEMHIEIACSSPHPLRQSALKIGSPMDPVRRVHCRTSTAAAMRGRTELGAQLCAALAAANTDDRAPRPRPHAQTEAVLASATTVVRLKSPLALGHRSDSFKSLPTAAGGNKSRFIARCQDVSDSLATLSWRLPPR